MRIAVFGSLLFVLFGCGEQVVVREVEVEIVCGDDKVEGEKACDRLCQAE